MPAEAPLEPCTTHGSLVLPLYLRADLEVPAVPTALQSSAEAKPESSPTGRCGRRHGLTQGASEKGNVVLFHSTCRHTAVVKHQL